MTIRRILDAALLAVICFIVGVYFGLHYETAEQRHTVEGLETRLSEYQQEAIRLDMICTQLNERPKK